MQFPLFGEVRKLVTHRFRIKDAVVSASETSTDHNSEGIKPFIKVQITNHKVVGSPRFCIVRGQSECLT